VTDDEVEDRVGDEAHDGGEVERREDAQEDGDDNDVDDDVDVEHEEATVVFSSTFLVGGRCFLPAVCLSRRLCLSG